MIEINKIDKLKEKFFHGSLEYTKNQPDFFLAHTFEIVSPSNGMNTLKAFKDSMADDKEILIYIHLPFCFSQCAFCNSFPHDVDKQQQDEYLELLLKDIEIYANESVFEGKKTKGVFFGGGTPTSFSNDSIRKIMDKIKKVCPLEVDATITLEAHPATLKNLKRIEELNEIGINRISMGCQTFDPKVLKLCNRQHTKDELKRIIDKLNELNMLSNIDMMAGLPGQTVESMKNDMKILEEIRPSAVEYMRHEIVNPLVVDLYKKNPELIASDEELFDMIYLMQSWMQEQGYEQNGYYEHKDSWEYRLHWIKEMPIVAFGSRTRSYSRTMSLDKHEHLPNYKKIIERGIAPISRCSELNLRDQMYRNLFLRLQLKEGLNISDFKSRFKKDPEDIFSDLFEKLLDFDCIEITDTHIILTELGSYYVEDVCDFIIDFVLEIESGDLERKPNSIGSFTSRLKEEIKA